MNLLVKGTGVVLAAAFVIGTTAPCSQAAAAHGGGLDAADRKKLDDSFAACMKAEKGPYTKNYCVCPDGERQPVQLPDGSLQTPCGGNMTFCAAWRTEPAEALASERVYIGNLFARDVFLWDDFPDHHDLVRGYILEKFFVDTHPDHKLARLRAYRGLAGVEYEAEASPVFFERYLDSDEFRESRHYLLAYELQRRFYLRNDQGQILTVRNLASAIHKRKSDFKPLRDAVHNQLSAAQIPRLEAYRDRLAAGDLRDQVQLLITEIEKLTSLDESVLDAQIAEIEGGATRDELDKAMADDDAATIEVIAGLARVMVVARREVEAKMAKAADRRRLIDAAITASTILQRRTTDLLESGTALTVREHIELMIALSSAAYGAGLLTERERAATVENLEVLLEKRRIDPEILAERLDVAARTVEWAQTGTQFAFVEVQAPWSRILPATHLISDDVLRGSALLLYARVLDALESGATGRDAIKHDILGTERSRDVRALNPGLAVGTLKVAAELGQYDRNDVVALADTPPDLEPAAGILTQGEGNVVSHVQLLARALGIPNVVLGPAAFELLRPYHGREVLLIVTAGGRAILKETAKMTDEDRLAVAEFTRNHQRSGDGGLGTGGRKLHIDADSLDLSITTAIDLRSLRTVDSGIRVGPKAAFLGELKHLFPDNVARGVVVPFGAYYDHYRRAPVALPDSLAGSGIAEPGESLSGFVERTYESFFDNMIPAGATEAELAAFIRPRLDIIRHSLVSTPLSPELRESIRRELESQGLLRTDDPSQTVGLFVRSDTNVEDLEDFNGAGLNLTIFNLRGLEEVYDGLREVWASPFTYRSFSWRQTIIDTPLWVLPSVVILESVPSEKSGVLVTTDINGGDRAKMLIATSEGVGGAVDGTPAETLLWSRDGVELITMFKSPWRRLLRDDGGSAIVPATGEDYVLTPEELEELVRAARKIRDKLEPSLDGSGKPRPWDIEFGFAAGKLWLFQARPFIGNEEVDNMPALEIYEVKAATRAGAVTLDDRLD